MASLTWRDGLDAGQYQTPQHPLQRTERSTGNPARGPAGTKYRQKKHKQMGDFLIIRLFKSHKYIYHSCNLWHNHLNTYIHTYSTNTNLACCTFMLRHPLGVLAALCGRELSHSDLAISSTHGQGGVSTVRQELCLCTLKAASVFG